MKNVDKNYRWGLAFIAILLVGILSLSGKPSHASADQIEIQISSTSSSCLSCHDDLYYLYDMGKSYCITEHKDRCVNCHEGNPTALDKDESHLGLIAYPQKDDGAKCQQCHPQDSQVRLDKFASMGGYKTVNEAACAGYLLIHPVFEELRQELRKSNKMTTPIYSDH